MNYLKCDAEGCDHRETVETYSEDMIGKPCPKCGANLLTREDYDVWMEHFAPAIALMQELGLVVSAVPGTPGSVGINFHDGELKMSMRSATKQPVET